MVMARPCEKEYTRVTKKVLAWAIKISIALHVALLAGAYTGSLFSST